MATAPVPFPTFPPVFFPATAPVYAPYHHQFPHFTAPVPFPSTYPPPASVYAPPPGFFPAPTTPQSSPPTSAPHLPAPLHPENSPWPDPAPLLELHDPATPSAFLPGATTSHAVPPALTREHPVHFSLRRWTFAARRKKTMARPRATASTLRLPNSGACAATSPWKTAPVTSPSPTRSSSTSTGLGSSPWSATTPTAVLPVQSVAEKSVPAKDASLHRLQRDFLNIQARFDQQQAHDQTSFDTIQGELVKLTSMVSQFAVSLGTQSTLAHASKPEQWQHISIVPAAPAHVAQMPTPRSCPRTYGSTLNYYHGQGTPIQSTCVPDVNSNLSEQTLNGMPQAYGLHNLNCQSVFRADGTEVSYYVLPENYPLERVTREPVLDAYDDETDGCSTAYVDVFASNTEQQPYEEEQQESAQLPKCFSQLTISSERPTVGTVGIFSLTNELTPEASQHSVQVLQQANQKWNMLLTEAGSKEWDPGVPQEQLQQVHTHEYNLMLPAKGIPEWDLGIGTPSSMYLWLKGLTARIATGTPFLLLNNTNYTWDSKIQY